jgi:diaminopimelate decarboxylase
MRMGGRPAAFGVDEEELIEAVDALSSLDWLEFRDIHLFAGTQILDYRILAAQYRKGIEIARRAGS